MCSPIFPYAVMASYEDGGVDVSDFKTFDEAEEEAAYYLQEGAIEVMIYDPLGDEVLRRYFKKENVS